MYLAIVYLTQCARKSVCGTEAHLTVGSLGGTSEVRGTKPPKIWGSLHTKMVKQVQMQDTMRQTLMLVLHLHSSQKRKIFYSCAYYPQLVTCQRKSLPLMLTITKIKMTINKAAQAVEYTNV